MERFKNIIRNHEIREYVEEEVERRLAMPIRHAELCSPICYVVEYIRVFRTKHFWTEEKELYVCALAKEGKQLPDLEKAFEVM